MDANAPIDTLGPLMEMLGPTVGPALKDARARLADDSIMVRAEHEVWTVERFGQPLKTGLVGEDNVAAFLKSLKTTKAPRAGN